MAWVPEHGTQHMCTPQNSVTDEQTWLDLGRTVTKLIRAKELCGSAEQPSDPLARRDLIRKALDSLQTRKT